MRPLRDDEPRAVGGFRVVGVVGVLGSGGMGRVFLGVAPDGRFAAVKQVLGAIADDPGFRTRFAREVDASRLVSGAYTAAVMAADPSAPAPWLASVFVPGPALDEAVREHGPLPEPTVRRLAVGLAVALTEIHRVGLVHRDLKPGNVLLADDGPRVIDFGISHAGTAAGTRLTRAGAVIGSPAFMSPEQVTDEPVGPASDVFALGSVLAFAATGAAPFGESPTAAVLYRVAHAEPDLARVPPGLRDLVAACLAKDPARRPAPDRVLAAAGPLPPTADWLPAPVAAMITARSAAARTLAGVAPAGPPTGPVGRRAAPPSGPAALGTPPLGARPGLPPAAAPPAPAPAPRRASWRRRAAVALVAAALATAAVVLAVVALRPGPPTPVEAAGLVSDVVPGSDEPPDGFEVYDDPDLPGLDGAPGDPLQIDRSHTAFACVPATDGPTPAESGVVALADSLFIEAGGGRVDRPRDQVAYTVAYLDEAARRDLVGEIRARIVECSTAEREDLLDVRLSLNTIAGANQQVGYLATLPNGEDDGIVVPPQVLACEFALAEAVLVRACRVLGADGGGRPLTPETVDDQDDRARAHTRDLMAPVLARARAEQAAQE